MTADTVVRVQRTDGPGLCRVKGSGLAMRHGVLCADHATDNRRRINAGRTNRPPKPAGGQPVGRDRLTPGLYWVDIARLAETPVPDQYPTGPCSTSGADFFAETIPDSRPAQRVCATCPNLFSCLARAVAEDEQWGIWGGTYRAERVRLRRLLQRHRARPAVAV